MRRRAGDDSDPTEQRLHRIERRLEDAEDSLAAALAPDRIDDLAQRVEQLSVTAVTLDDLLRVRTDVARVAAEVTKVRAKLEAELDELTAVVLDLADPQGRRRAAG